MFDINEELKNVSESSQRVQDLKRELIKLFGDIDLFLTSEGLFLKTKNARKKSIDKLLEYIPDCNYMIFVDGEYLSFQITGE